MMKKVLISLVLILISLPAFPQDSSLFQQAYKWLEDKKISLRKTFDGSSKDEGKPASITWSRDYENNAEIFGLDAGLKISEISLLDNTKSILIFYPKLEYHRDNTKEKEKNNFGGGINAEFIPFPIDNMAVAPWLAGSSDYKYDFIKQNGTVVLSGLASLKSIKPFLPGSSTRDKQRRLILRYYPYSGIEYYTSSSHDTAKDASFWASRIFAEVWPLPSFSKQYFQITVDYTYRVKLSDNLYNGTDVSLFSASANIYPDGVGKFGLGIDYTVGEDPTNNFVHIEKAGLSIKLKL